MKIQYAAFILLLTLLSCTSYKSVLMINNGSKYSLKVENSLCPCGITYLHVYYREKPGEEIFWEFECPDTILHNLSTKLLRKEIRVIKGDKIQRTLVYEGIPDTARIMPTQLFAREDSIVYQQLPMLIGDGTCFNGLPLQGIKGYIFRHVIIGGGKTRFGKIKMK